MKALFSINVISTQIQPWHDGLIDLISISVLKKEPEITQEDNLKAGVDIEELDTDVTSEECREFTKRLRKFYFGEVEECAMPKMTYFLVIEIVILKF